MQRQPPFRWPSPGVLLAVVAAVAIVACVGSGSARSAGASPIASPRGADGRCSPGARTLSAPGAVLYPGVGNGGYKSVHTATHTVYDAATNRFLPGNRVDLTDRATRCLSSVSVDFERFEPGQPKDGPDMRVQSVNIDGVPASFRFAQPTYPGDPKGARRPRSPRARGLPA